VGVKADGDSGEGELAMNGGAEGKIWGGVMVMHLRVGSGAWTEKSMHGQHEALGQMHWMLI
jgi:hypothetical protein